MQKTTYTNIKEVIVQENPHMRVVTRAKMFYKYTHPTTMLINGNSGCGKTFLTLSLLSNPNRYFDKEIKEILYYYHIYNRCFDDFPHIKFIQGLPESLPDDNLNRIIVIDDSHEKGINLAASLFVRESHHLNITVIFLLQYLFLNSKLRIVSLNSKNIITFVNHRDSLSFNTLARQLPYDTKLVQSIYKHATRTKHGYLAINLSNDCPENLRFSTNITSEHPTYFVPAEKYHGKEIEINENVE